MTLPKLWRGSLPDHPDLPIKPPLIFVIAMAIGFGADWIWPVPVRPAGWSSAGLAIALLAILLIFWSADLFRRRGTEVVPWKPTTTIVTTGPYAVSRNPIYIGFALVQIGIGVATNRLAVVLMVIPALVATHTIVVAREEAYLTRKFGEEYLEYRRRVRRWV